MKTIEIEKAKFEVSTSQKHKWGEFFVLKSNGNGFLLHRGSDGRNYIMPLKGEGQSIREVNI